MKGCKKKRGEVKLGLKTSVMVAPEHLGLGMNRLYEWVWYLMLGRFILLMVSFASNESADAQFVVPFELNNVFIIFVHIGKFRAIKPSLLLNQVLN